MLFMSIPNLLNEKKKREREKKNIIDAWAWTAFNIGNIHCPNHE